MRAVDVFPLVSERSADGTAESLNQPHYWFLLELTHAGRLGAALRAVDMPIVILARGRVPNDAGEAVSELRREVVMSQDIGDESASGHR